MLGYIGSFPIPEVISGINSTMLGAQSVNPNIKVKIIWVNTWFDPGKEADAAKALLDQGADILMQHTDSPAAMQIASQRNALAFGQTPTWPSSVPRRSSPASSTTGRRITSTGCRPPRRQVEVGRQVGRARNQDGDDGALRQHA